MIPYKETRGADGVVTIRTYNPDLTDPIVIVNSTHPHFEAIREGLRNGDSEVWDLIDVASGVMRKFQSITERVSYDGADILWDGDPIHTALAEQVKRALETGEQDYAALAKFWEKLESNPEPHSREQAYNWLASHDFKITSDGDLVAYKGVYDNGDGTFRSSAVSQADGLPSAYVDGVALKPRVYVTQSIGSVVSLPRSEVVHDPTRACERGLHVGTFPYASRYGNTVVEVHANPRDLCSVPTDGGGEKVRVNRYKVVAVVTQEHEGRQPVVAASGASNWSDVGYGGF